MSKEHQNGSTPSPRQDENTVWFLHVIPYGESISIPEAGEVTPWLCVIAEREEREALAMTAHRERPGAEIVREILGDEIASGGVIPRAIKVFDPELSQQITQLATEHNIEVVLHTVDADEMAAIVEEFTAGIDPDELVLALIEISPEQEDAIHLMTMVEEECRPSDQEWLLHFVPWPEDVTVEGLGRVSPWVGTVVRKGEEPTLAMVSPEAPTPDVLIATTIGHMIKTKVIPSSIEVIEPEYLEFIAAMGEIYGFTSSVTDLPEHTDRLASFARTVDPDHLIRRLNEYAGLQ